MEKMTEKQMMEVFEKLQGLQKEMFAEKSETSIHINSSWFRRIENLSMGFSITVFVHKDGECEMFSFSEWNEKKEIEEEFNKLKNFIA